MNNEIKIYPAMVRCGESPRNVTVNVRAPKVGFLIYSKITVYVSIQSVKVQAVCLYSKRVSTKAVFSTTKTVQSATHSVLFV